MRSPLLSLFAVLLAPSLLAEKTPNPQMLANEEALAHLKDAGQYQSLSEAIQTARYSAQEVANEPQKIWVQNQRHALKATFDSEGLHLDVSDANQKHYQSNWRLASVGGGQVSTGELRHDGQNVEIVRPGITEWFINRPTGLEHGFTLAHRPAEAGDQLQLAMTLTGDLVIAVSEDGQGAELQDEASGEKVLNYDKLRVWDSSGTELPAQMIAAKGGTELQLKVNDDGARYPLTIDPTFTQQAFLIADDATAGDEFGGAVAVSGDTVVIGAAEEGLNEGTVYVFVRNGSTWSQQAFLKASNAQRDDEFGHAVAISGDTIVIGSIEEDSGFNNGPNDNSSPRSGAVYVFTRDGTTWSQQAFLKAANGEAADFFGSSVAVFEDTLVVGATGEDSNTAGGDNNDAEDSGAAYVFVREETTWTQQAFLKASNAGADDNFGGSVGVSTNTIVVGASGEDSSFADGSIDNSESSSGAAYVFVRNGTSWSESAFLKADNARDDDGFGTSVAISEGTIVIGAPREGTNSSGSRTNSGGAYIFVRNGTVWTQEALLKADVEGNADQLGQAVAISGNRVVAGTAFEDSSATGGPTNNSATNSGAAYVFERNGTTWSQTEFLKADNAERSDSFGLSVGISANIIIVGADGESTAGDSAGAAYVFEAPLPVVVTDVVFDQALNIVTLTWRSSPGSTYRVDYSLDLINRMENLESGILHDVDGGGLTSQAIDLDGTGLDGAMKGFLHVVEE